MLPDEARRRVLNGAVRDDVPPGRWADARRGAPAHAARVMHARNVSRNGVPVAEVDDPVLRGAGDRRGGPEGDRSRALERGVDGRVLHREVHDRHELDVRGQSPVAVACERQLGAVVVYIAEHVAVRDRRGALHPHQLRDVVGHGAVAVVGVVLRIRGAAADVGRVVGHRPLGPLERRARRADGAVERARELDVDETALVVARAAVLVRGAVPHGTVGHHARVLAGPGIAAGADAAARQLLDAVDRVTPDARACDHRD